MPMKDEKGTLKYLKQYGSKGPIEKVFSMLKDLCEEHDIDFTKAHEILGEAIKWQCRSDKGTKVFIDYWNHLMDLQEGLEQMTA